MNDSGIDLIILILSKLEQNSIRGRLKLHKLLFLLIKEAGLERFEDEFSFEPYKFGPWSPVVDSYLELLDDNGILTIENIPNDTYECFETDDNEFINNYSLTKLGRKIANQLRKIYENQELGLTNVLDTYSRLSNHTLLRYVYTNYPRFKEKSIVKEEIPTLPPMEEFKISFPDEEIDEDLFSFVGIIPKISRSEEKEVLDKIILGINNDIC